ncbi:DNA methyltransferase [Mesoplasma coleopterae]|uniref:site-specific DNA-methyltransferase (cytosine-N(4)-specific) n=1 Tax=Mesoplasma coleopterae TaxID=324078 RepID=A0A2K8P261_9MOLU|nr:DNA methyltransferase [Mesoplasma coleopterae]ATZ20844.1 type II R/M system DNA methylase [Mesoplasma coleopterae]
MNEKDIKYNLYDENFEIVKEEYLNYSETWKNKSRIWGDQTHRLCSYVAMFPPSLANFFITKYTNENDVILDTFSGRGTTILESRLMNRKAYANDLNPFAFVLSKSKTKSFNTQEIFKRVDQLERRYQNYNKKTLKLEKDLQIYFSDKNLKQITFLKYELGKKWKDLDDIDNFILAIFLGILHGPMKKNGDSIYLSLSMSNHTSMSKKYVQKYAQDNNLKKPSFNIFDKVKNRAEKIIINSKYEKNEACVKYGNALEVDKIFPNLNPKLVITSPPYLNIINYTNQNWLKMWVLGYDNRHDNKEIGLDDSHNLLNYKNFMSKYLWKISKIISKEGKIVLVIGDVFQNGKNYSFEDIWKEIRKDFLDLYLKEIYVDKIEQNYKSTNSMGSKAGKATKVEKIYVFEKIDKLKFKD